MSAEPKQLFDEIMAMPAPKRLRFAAQAIDKKMDPKIIRAIVNTVVTELDELILFGAKAK